MANPIAVRGINAFTLGNRPEFAADGPKTRDGIPASRTGASPGWRVFRLQLALRMDGPLAEIRGGPFVRAPLKH